MANVKVIIPIIIIIIIAAVLIIFTSNEETTKNEIEEKWVESGPFAIDKSQYNVGSEKKSMKLLSSMFVTIVLVHWM